MISYITAFIRKIAREEIALERRSITKRTELFAPFPEEKVVQFPKREEGR